MDAVQAASPDWVSLVVELAKGGSVGILAGGLVMAGYTIKNLYKEVIDGKNALNTALREMTATTERLLKEGDHALEGITRLLEDMRARMGGGK